MNIQPLIDKIALAVKQHAIPARPGSYSRFPGGESNEYGCADAANILYTIGHFERDPELRAASVAVLRKFQDPENGLFREATHHPYHTTAHCVAALELFDAAPLYPLKALDPYRTPEGIVSKLESLSWLGDPRLHGHEGSGIYAALSITGLTNSAWKDSYFGWLSENCDPDFGLGRKGMVNVQLQTAYHLFDWFHYLFNFHAANRPFPYPEKLIDTCLDLFRRKDLTEAFNHMCGFWEIDWVFCVNRATRQTKYRFEECRQALHEEGLELVKMLSKTENLSDVRRADDLHMLFGTTCALAEVQLALPGEFQTDISLKNVLDRRPFI